MPISLTELNPNFLIYAGAIGIFLGLLFFIYFLYRRIRWIIQVLSRQKTTSPKLLSGLGKLLLILIWISCFGMLLFISAFLRAYHVFTYEKPIAEIRTQKLDREKTYPSAVVHFSSTQPNIRRHLFIKGDQWMIEGDILKWKNWLNFLGLHTRYRLTRIRGRYLSTEAELHQPQSIHSLVSQEKHPLWGYLYQYGQRLPFVSTVYGNASFQNLGEDRTYLIYIGPSGFIIREKVQQKQSS